MLDQGYDGLTEIFTRRQAGKLFDALEGDVAHVRRCATPRSRSTRASRSARWPRAVASARRGQAAHARRSDARAAVQLLVPTA